MADPPADDRFTMEFPALRQRTYAIAYRLLGARGAAEDIAQETLTRAYASRSKIDGDPTGWCVTVALRLTLDQLRTAERDRRRRRQLIAISSPLSVADPYAAERLDLQAALLKLPKRQREIVALRYLGDLSEAQTARVLGISVGTVKSQASRGLANLRTHLVVVSEPTGSNHV